jgi:hypothetical protein
MAHFVATFFELALVVSFQIDVRTLDSMVRHNAYSSLDPAPSGSGDVASWHLAAAGGERESVSATPAWGFVGWSRYSLHGPLSNGSLLSGRGISMDANNYFLWKKTQNSFLSFFSVFLSVSLPPPHPPPFSGRSKCWSGQQTAAKTPQ